MSNAAWLFWVVLFGSIAIGAFWSLVRWWLKRRQPVGGLFRHVQKELAAQKRIGHSSISGWVE